MLRIELGMYLNHSTSDRHKELQICEFVSPKHNGSVYMICKLAVAFLDALYVFDQWLSVSP